MLRGNRLFIVALGLILAAHHPNLEAQPKQAAAQERSAKALENIAATYDKQAKGAERSPESNPCKPGDDQRNSDLCAQWKAADAAADSAWWAAVGGFASAVSTLLVLIALWLAFRSNWIARDTAKRQLRAYVNVTEIQSIEFGIGFTPRIAIRVTNKGQTPAHNVETILTVAYSVVPLNDSNIVGNVKDVSRTILAVGEAVTTEVAMPSEITQEFLDNLRDKKVFVTARLTIAYQDIFGDPQTTTFRAEMLPDGRFGHSRDGNHAT